MNAILSCCRFFSRKQYQSLSTNNDDDEMDRIQMFNDPSLFNIREIFDQRGFIRTEKVDNFAKAHFSCLKDYIITETIFEEIRSVVRQNAEKSNLLRMVYMRIVLQQKFENPLIRDRFHGMLCSVCSVGS